MRRISRFGGIGVLVIGWAIGGWAGAGQEPSQDAVFSGSMDVNVVNIEAFVSRRGEPVQGLTAADFEVFLDGEPVKIDNFTEIKSSTVRGDEPDMALQGAGAGPEARLRGSATGPEELHLLVFVDLFFTRGRSLRRALPAIIGFLEENHGPHVQVSVALFNGRLKTALPMTSDMEQVRAVLEELARSGTHGEVLDRQTVMMMEELAAGLEGIGQSSGSAAAAPSISTAEDVREMVGSSARLASEEARWTAARGWNALCAAIAHLGAPASGRKALLLVSDGFVIDVRPASIADIGFGVRSLYEGGRMLSRLHREVVELANAMGVTIYSVNAGGLSRGDDTGALRPDVSGRVALGRTDSFRSTAFSREASGMQGLTLTASLTGGTSVLKPTSTTMRAIADDLRSCYSIGIRVPPGSGSEQRKVTIKVAGAGVQVRHRPSVWTLSDRERAATRALAALLVEGPDNPLGLSFEVRAPAPAEEGKLSVPLRMRLPADRLALIPDGEYLRGSVRFFVVAESAGGTLSPITEMMVPLRFKPEVLKDDRLQLLAFDTEIELPAGISTVAVTALDEPAGIVASVSGQVNVAEGGGAGG